MSKTISGFLIIIAILFSILSIVYPVYAQEKDSSYSAQSRESTSSFQLFWPIVAGKTVDDPLYRFKLLKEQIRGWLIFGEAPKADYEVALSTKRILEVEKLLKDNKNDSAIKTLDQALLKLRDARLNIAKAQKSENSFPPIKVDLINQLSNLNVFVPRLNENAQGDVRNRLDKVKENVEQFLEELH